MKFSIDNIIKINKKFGGNLLNRNSLDFAFEKAKEEKNIFKSNAYLLRGIIVDHPFLDGNKRTAITIISKRFSDNDIKCDKKKMAKGVVDIAKKNINSINKIEGKLRKWCLKN